MTPFPLYRPSDQTVYIPLIVPGETTSFYINAPVTLPGTLSLKLVEAYSLEVVVDSIGTLNRLSSLNGDYLYSSFTCPVAANGSYRLAVFEGAVMKYASNVLFLTNKNYDQISAKVKFRHDRNIFSFFYDEIPNYYNEIRLGVIEADRQNDYDLDQYKSVTSSKIRNFKEVTRKVVKFETYYFDEAAHEAAMEMVYQELYINGNKCTYKTLYKKNTDPISRACKGEFEVFIDDYSNEKGKVFEAV